MTSFGHDVSRSVKDGKPFLIMEEQTGKAGQPIFSPQPEPGQLRLWSYQAVAHGAMGINYFRWDTANFGAEEYWHGLLRHDRSHSPGFDEIQQTMAELKSLGRDALMAPYEAKLALCYDYSADWALGIQPGQPKLKYMRRDGAMVWLHGGFACRRGHCGRHAGPFAIQGGMRARDVHRERGAGRSHSRICSARRNIHCGLPAWREG